MRIGVVTCMWQRPEIFNIYATGINRLREKFEIIPIAVGSEGKKSLNLCKKHGFMYLERPNRPLGRKFNNGLLCLKNQRVDYVMIMGSDDLVSDSLLEAYMPHMEAGADMIGILDIYFYDMALKSLHYWPGYGLKAADKYRRGEPIGMARCLSIDLIQQLNWNLWDDNINRGLDGSMWNKLRKIKVKPITMKLKDIGAMGVDLKSDVNICNRVMYTCDTVDPEMMNLLGDKEIELIKSYAAK